MSPASYQTAPPRAVAAAFFLLSRVRAAALPRRAGNGTRTRDPNLGKVVLYQLSYSRVGQNIVGELATSLGKLVNWSGQIRCPNACTAYHADQATKPDNAASPPFMSA